MAFTLRPEPNEQKLLDKLCKITGKVTTKSLMIAADFYVNQKNQMEAMIQKLRQDKEELQEKLDDIKEMYQEKTELEERINNFFIPEKPKRNSKSKL